MGSESLVDAAIIARFPELPSSLTFSTPAGIKG
jgi:hypothetical protein